MTTATMLEATPLKVATTTAHRSGDDGQPRGPLALRDDSPVEQCPQIPRPLFGWRRLRRQPDGEGRAGSLLALNFH